MAQKSRLLHINDYCLIEYIYADSNQAEEQYNLTVLYNSITNTHQIFNSDADYAITNNIQANSLIVYDKNQYVQLDEQNSILDYNTSIKKSTNISGSYKYDYIRFHFMSGANISAFDNLVLSAKYVENDGKTIILASVGLNSVNFINMISYNSDPIYLSDSVYDKYVEVKIPSVKQLNYDYYVTPLNQRGSTLSAKITSNDVTNLNGTFTGLVNNAPIQFSVDECKNSSQLKTQFYDSNSKYIIKSYTLYKVDSHIEASLPLINDYDEFTATINEVSDGNYFEYYASVDNGSFADDFINTLKIKTNSQDWVLIHQLNIYENTQFSGSYLTSTQTTYQNDRFDEPQLFRPILKNAGIDVNFKIDYIVRLLNQTTGEQIIRNASIISDNVNKYGKNTVGIKVSGTPNRIYNKVYKSNTSQLQLYMEPDSIAVDSIQHGTVTFVDKIVQYPLYIDYSLISLSEINLKVVDSNVLNKIVYKQGDLRLIIKPFDNFFKFKVYQETNGQLNSLSLDSSNIYKLVFMSNNKNGKAEFISITDDNTLKLANGDLLFKVPMLDAVKILMFTNREFYITSYNPTSLYESVMYSGFWYMQSELQKYNKYISDLKISYNLDDINNTKIQDLIDSSIQQSITIPTDIYIPGYVDQSSNGSEKSSVSVIQPKS